MLALLTTLLVVDINFIYRKLLMEGARLGSCGVKCRGRCGNENFNPNQ